MINTQMKKSIKINMNKIKDAITAKESDGIKIGQMLIVKLHLIKFMADNAKSIVDWIESPNEYSCSIPTTICPKLVRALDLIPGDDMTFEEKLDNIARSIHKEYGILVRVYIGSLGYTLDGDADQTNTDKVIIQFGGLISLV